MNIECKINAILLVSIFFIFKTQNKYFTEHNKQNNTCTLSSTNFSAPLG